MLQLININEMCLIISDISAKGMLLCLNHGSIALINGQFDIVLLAYLNVLTWVYSYGVLVLSSSNGIIR